MDVIDELCLPLAEKMWSVHHDLPGGPRLIFPFKRGDSVRVSEQESKILLCEVLEETPYYYSVETPTRETYQQSGQFALSARIDVTVYGTRFASDRLLNVELKQGTASLEAFRKDFEKLSREGVESLWFHTLERGDRRTIATVRRWMNQAMLLLKDHTKMARHQLTVAICLLQQQVLLTANVRFGETFSDAWGELFADGAPGWGVSGPGTEDFIAALSPVVPARRRPERGTNVGEQDCIHGMPTRECAICSAATRWVSAPSGDRVGHEKLLVFCPTITDDSLLHFNRQGDSYRLRAFAGRLAGRPAWTQPDAPTSADFLRIYEPLYKIDVVSEQLSVERVDRLADIIARHNRRLNICTADQV